MAKGKIFRNDVIALKIFIVMIFALVPVKFVSSKTDSMMSMNLRLK